MNFVKTTIGKFSERLKSKINKPDPNTLYFVSMDLTSGTVGDSTVLDNVNAPYMLYMGSKMVGNSTTIYITSNSGNAEFISSNMLNLIKPFSIGNIHIDYNDVNSIKWSVNINSSIEDLYNIKLCVLNKDTNERKYLKVLTDSHGNKILDDTNPNRFVIGIYESSTQYAYGYMYESDNTVELFTDTTNNPSTVSGIQTSFIENLSVNSVSHFDIEFCGLKSFEFNANNYIEGSLKLYRYIQNEDSTLTTVEYLDDGTVVDGKSKLIHYTSNEQYSIDGYIVGNLVNISQDSQLYFNFEDSLSDLTYNYKIKIGNLNALSQAIPGVPGQSLFVTDIFYNQSGKKDRGTSMFVWDESIDGGQWVNANLVYTNRLVFYSDTGEDGIEDDVALSGEDIRKLKELLQ